MKAILSFLVLALLLTKSNAQKTSILLGNNFTYVKDWKKVNYFNPEIQVMHRLKKKFGVSVGFNVFKGDIFNTPIAKRPI